MALRSHHSGDNASHLKCPGGGAKEGRGLGRCHSAHCAEQPQGALQTGKVTVTISGSCCDWRTSPAHAELRRRGG